MTVENDQVSPPQLPVTGANTSVLMTLGGIALLLVATGLILHASRKRRESEPAE